MILEKSSSIMGSCKVSEDDVQTLFNIVKTKLHILITKDTNASVRDAAVLVLTRFKAKLPLSPEINEAVNCLPKYRIAEITKRVQENLEMGHTEEAEGMDTFKGKDAR